MEVIILYQRKGSPYPEEHRIDAADEMSGYLAAYTPSGARERSAVLLPPPEDGLQAKEPHPGSPEL